jgi:hypothetical protein
MARVFTEGFEMGDKLFFNSISNASDVATDQVRSGTYSFKFLQQTIGATKIISGLSEFYFRMGFRTSSLLYIPQLQWRNSTTILGSMRFNSSTNSIDIYTGTSTKVADGTISLTVDTWCLIELHIKIADSGGVITVKIDGVEDAEFTGDTKPGSATVVDNLTWVTPNNSFNVWIDDLALNDTTGGADDSWCGDGYVVALTPNGDVSKQWTPSAGSDNYAMVDEKPADNDTTYIETSTNGHQDHYSLTDFDGAGKTVLRVWAEARARDTVADADGVKLGVYSGTTESMGGTVQLLTTYTKQILGTAMTVNPDDSAAWEDADLDALELVIEAVV